MGIPITSVVILIQNGQRNVDMQSCIIDKPRIQATVYLDAGGSDTFEMCRLCHGYGITRGVLETGSTGTGRVL